MTPIYNQYKNYLFLNKRKNKNQNKIVSDNYKFIYVF